MSLVSALAHRIVDAALDPDGGVPAGSLGLKIVEAVDPPVEASVSFEIPRTVEDVDKMSLSELLVVADRLGIETPPGLPSG
jgi:hypothetical protein